MERRREVIVPLREQIDRLIEAGSYPAAVCDLADFWRSDPGPATAAFVNSRFEKMRDQLPLHPWRLAILRSFTVEPLVPLLRAEAFLAGIELTVHIGEFNAWAQELLDPASALYRFGPDAIILAVHDYESDQMRLCLDVLRCHSNAHVILHTREAGVIPRRGILDAQIEASEWAEQQKTNAGIRALAREYRGVYVLDYDALVARHGRQGWHDGRKWLTARMRISAARLPDMVREWMRFIHPLAGRVAKAVVVDLDNTLWGGVIGEDGVAGIQLGSEYPGAAYQEVQRALLDVHGRGILLAVCSKNNEAEAMEALERHPGMLLRPRHFAALRINWEEKARNLLEIAAELNISADALAFVDDNPVERRKVRMQLPEVRVVELPQNPMDYAQALRDCPLFERLTLSAEDLQRGQYYADERQRRRLEQRISSLEEFYQSLEQEVEIAPMTALTLGRAAQLTQKTNQFNLTTRRYSEQEMAAISRSPCYRVYVLRVKDRFADNGLVGVAILQCGGQAWEIDTFLMSCRVFGRTVETAFLSGLTEQARQAGACTLEGWFIPTAKNAPSKDFYPRHHFQLVETTDKGSRWALDLASPVACPPWIRLNYAGEHH